MHHFLDGLDRSDERLRQTYPESYCFTDFVTGRYPIRRIVLMPRSTGPKGHSRALAPLYELLDVASFSNRHNRIVLATIPGIKNLCLLPSSPTQPVAGVLFTRWVIGSSEWH